MCPDHDETAAGRAYVIRTGSDNSTGSNDVSSSSALQYRGGRKYRGIPGVGGHTGCHISAKSRADSVGVDSHDSRIGLIVGAEFYSNNVRVKYPAADIGLVHIAIACAGACCADRCPGIAIAVGIHLENQDVASCRSEPLTINTDGDTSRTGGIGDANIKTGNCPTLEHRCKHRGLQLGYVANAGIDGPDCFVVTRMTVPSLANCGDISIPTNVDGPP